MSGEALHKAEEFSVPLHKAEEFSVTVRHLRKYLEMLGMITSHSKCQEDEGWFCHAAYFRATRSLSQI